MKDPKIVSEKPTQWKVLAELELEPDGDIETCANGAIEAVTASVESLDLPKAHLERMQAALLRTSVRAMDMGASQEPPRPVVLRALASQTLDPSQGWGFFLIERRAEGLAAATEQAAAAEQGSASEQAAGEGGDVNGRDGSLCLRPCVIIELYLYREGERLRHGRDVSLQG